MNNKEKIKREALYLFAEKGFDKTSVREIAKKVGIRESAIYNHYKSKTDIFLALVSDAQKRLSVARFVDDELMNRLNDPEKFLTALAERIIKTWCKKEDKAYTKLLIQAKFNSSLKFEFKLEDLFANLRKLLEIIFDALKNYGYVKNYPTEFLTDEFLSPLIVLKFRFLINDFFDYEQVLIYAREYVEIFWRQIKND
jgi:AcrR family transcriptional regulator